MTSVPLRARRAAAHANRVRSGRRGRYHSVLCKTHDVGLTERRLHGVYVTTLRLTDVLIAQASEGLAVDIQLTSMDVDSLHISSLDAC